MLEFRFDRRARGKYVRVLCKEFSVFGRTMEQDSDLIRRINQGDTDAFETLYRRWRDWVWRLAWRFTGTPDLAQDVLQETFLYLLKKVPHLRLTARMSTFLYPVVRHISRDLRRKAGIASADECLLGDVPIMTQDSAEQTRRDLATVLSILPPAQQEVLLMRFIDDMTMEEIAQALDIPVGTVKSRLHNALQTLRSDERTRHYFLGQ